jgi:hypothetical protein
MKWHQLFSTLLEKLRHVGEKQWTLKRKNKQYSDQLGGKERWLNKESVNGGQCGSKKDNQWTSTFRSHQGAILFKDSQDLVNSSSKWEWWCTWRTSVSRFNLLNMVIDRCGHTIECKWMLKRCTPPRLIVEQCCTWRTSSYLHLGLPS